MIEHAKPMLPASCWGNTAQMPLPRTPAPAQHPQTPLACTNLSRSASARLSARSASASPRTCGAGSVELSVEEWRRGCG